MNDSGDDIMARIVEMNSTLNDLYDQYATYKINVNNFYQTLNGMFLFFGSAGFAFIEFGTVSSKNATSILLKNFVALYAAGMAYWLFGYALAYGSQTNPMAGTRAWAGEGMDMTQYANWFYQFSFSSTSASIVSVATAERGYLLVDIAFAFYMTGFVFPVIEHWAWDPSGWLKKGDGDVGYEDFSGSGVINLTGGAAAIVATLIIGPRIGRFKTFKGMVRPHSLQIESVPMLCLVAYIMTVATIAFNESSTTTITEPGDGGIASNAVRNTMITSCFAAVTGFVAHRVGMNVTKHQAPWSFKVALNALLTGVFASQANCEAIYDWGACIVGVVSALAYLGLQKIITKMQIDDVADAIPVHFGGGLCGVLLRPVLKKGGILLAGNTGRPWKLAGAATYTLWSGGLTALFYGLLRLVHLHRLPLETQIEGLDVQISDSAMTNKKKSEADKPPPVFIANLAKRMLEGAPPSPNAKGVFLRPVLTSMIEEPTQQPGRTPMI